MKNKMGRFIGFISGVNGFLFVFFLINISPSDELAPGVVVFGSLLSGLLFAFVGARIQRYFGNRSA